MLKRKIEKQLLDWKENTGHKPLVIKGCRQCGKTYSVREFARKYYDSTVYINFFEDSHYKEIFADSLQVDNLTVMMSALLPQKVRFVPGKTIIILDEIQECPEARTALKFFHLDGRYDVIATGSLLGVKGYRDELRSVPVGYESVLEMHPLDFEEFLWAMGVAPEVITLLSECLQQERSVPAAIHGKLQDLLLKYIVVGGMPEAVKAFINTSSMAEVQDIQRNIVRSYLDDMVKYAEKKDKALIRECFMSIPAQLSKENKKFQYSLAVKRGTAKRCEGSLQFIEDAGIIARCYSVSALELPLNGAAERDKFKVYMQDTGLFISMLEQGTAGDILTGNLAVYKGAIFENIVADFFAKMGRPLYYFKKDSGLEIDFVLRYKGECTLLEVKATTGNAKSLRTVLNAPERYHVKRALKLGAYNVGRAGNVLTLPLYMGFLLREY